MLKQILHFVPNVSLLTKDIFILDIMSINITRVIRNEIDSQTTNKPTKGNEGCTNFIKHTYLGTLL